ncbi:DHH family phosphoesterase [Bacillus sp. HMF5848]|uniref:DHH family phosphoesterase n=1 Tax=Bacillus sp. HMF5848 TaxID=2495421 RepID=UPI000F76EFB9|nr:DHH family phosphoesterase [Bacillus sp. HMF5848]RSK29176.1 DHH family phosphoesterase [Bacillus sp. HMF5848]
MPSFFEKPMFRYSMYGFIALIILLIGLLTYFQWVIGILTFLMFAAIVIVLIKAQIQVKQEMEAYISTLSYRIKKVGEEALMEMPIGIMLFNDDYIVEWSNPYMTSCFEEDSLVGKSLYDLADSLIPIIKQEVETEVINLQERKLKVVLKREERLLYFFDVTEQTEIEKLYEDERTVLGVIFLDNYDEITQGMDDQTKSNINSQVTAILNKWSKDNGVFIKRTSSERFIAILNENILKHLEKNKFSVLDEVRERTSKHTIPLTLSIGIGSGAASLPELGALAQSSLDLALGRGGDQVAIKQQNGKVKFFGGKSNPMEKRTRVRARVISHALKELVTESDRVFIMGHKSPDMDAVGAAIGILKVTEINGKDGYIVLDPSDIDTGVKRLLDEVEKQTDLWSRFVTPEQAMELATDESLLVVVDTHKPSLVIEERLLKMERVVVIDHHRRGEEFINDPILVYMEPYASSTSELVTELLEYQPKHTKIDMLESTALLAGIIVDTKSFTLRTGARTFDAASYLRSQGADTVLVQRLLKEDLDTFVMRAKLVETAQMYRDGMTIAKSGEHEAFNQVLIAQAADTLLSLNGVTASFVISKRQDGVIAISARSLGSTNVQIIMEMLGGGGHLTNAATQLYDTTIEEAEHALHEAIDEYLEGGKPS